MTQAALSSVRHGRTVTTVSRAGHYPNLDQPERWATIVDGFLDDLGIFALDARL